MAKIGVIGAGIIGRDVAITCALHGFSVVLCDNDVLVREAACAEIRRMVRRYRMMSDAPVMSVDDVVGSISISGDIADLRGSVWLVENIVEERHAKESLYRELAVNVEPGSFVAVNTSCIPITYLASLLPLPERVLGMHFMNPVPLVAGLEVIRGRRTSSATVAAAREFAEALGKTTVVVNDAPGFVSNRLSHLFMNEAAFLVQEGVAEPPEIDAIFRLGYGHRMGPLETADLIGLDTVVASLAVLHDEYQDSKFRCCPLLKRMVEAGELGCKSGQGFYQYAVN